MSQVVRVLGTAGICAALLASATTYSAAQAGAPGAEPTVGGTAGAGDLASPRTSSEGVEVVTYGTAAVANNMDSGLSPVYQAVHGVRRTADRTVVYWSAGWQETPDVRIFGAMGRNPFPQRLLDANTSAPFVNVLLPEQGLLLYGVPDPEASGPQRAATSGVDALPREPGVMGVMYTVLPPLPEGVDTVDVTLGYASVVTDVPVEDGLLEPTVEGPVVPLGSGWPEIPEAMLAPVERPVLSVRPLSSPSEDIDGFSREAETGEQVTIDVAADVLFATDSAELTAEATGRLGELAAELQERAAPGELRVVGHTDDRASEEYNQDLSERRAQAVADVLGATLTGADLRLVVEGRGETEPVADNGSDEGRQLNRRVTVSFTEQEG